MTKEISIEGLRLSYSESGAGPAMIIMHGWGCTSQTMAFFERIASENHTVYNLDMPGFGNSDEPPTVWTVDDYADLLHKFVVALGIERPSLTGHSFGGRVAILYASQHPVDRIVLVDAAGVKPRRSPRYYIKVYSFKAAKALANTFLPKQRAQALIDRMRGKAGSSDYAQASPKMRAVMSRVVNQDLRHAMPLIKAPTLLLWGEKDTATPIGDARIMERLIPDAGLVSFPGAGHFSWLDEPYRSEAVYRNFLNN